MLSCEIVVLGGCESDGNRENFYTSHQNKKSSWFFHFLLKEPFFLLSFSFFFFPFFPSGLSPPPFEIFGNLTISLIGKSVFLQGKSTKMIRFTKRQKNKKMRIIITGKRQKIKRNTIHLYSLFFVVLRNFGLCSGIN